MELRKNIAIGLVALMPLSLGACEDEDDDGAVTDEEVGEIADTLEEGADELEEEIEEGSDEVDDDSG